MTEYFKLSQKIKSEIENSDELISALKKHMSGESLLEQIGQGTANVHYRLGQIESGYWITTREMRLPTYMRTSGPVLSGYESYALRAESYAEKGLIVPNFSVGVFLNRNAILLVEDLTLGGSRKLIHDNSNHWGYFADNRTERIYIDLEDDYPDYSDLEFKFMKTENSIVLS